MSKKRIPFATGGWVNTQSSGDMPFSGEVVVSKDEQERLAELLKNEGARLTRVGVETKAYIQRKGDSDEETDEPANGGSTNSGGNAGGDNNGGGVTPPGGNTGNDD